MCKIVVILQRLTKYQLMLKDLLGTCHPNDGKYEIQECLDNMLQVIRSVNDSLHQVNIINLPNLLHPLGSLICQVRFHNILLIIKGIT